MPIHQVFKNGKAIGWQYGEKGTVYRSRDDAVKQAQAIKASQAAAKKKKK